MPDAGCRMPDGDAAPVVRREHGGLRRGESEGASSWAERAESGTGAVSAGGAVEDLPAAVQSRRRCGTALFVLSRPGKVEMMLTKKHAAAVLTAVLAVGCVTTSAWAADPPRPEPKKSAPRHTGDVSECPGGGPQQQSGDTPILGGLVTGGLLGEAFSRSHLCRIEVSVVDREPGRGDVLA
ncbi:hypothetical protein ACFY12_14465 [Streptomyces sp. NPDC001339]|uniref:hypothetical protein n=1 Tax=Streptomyces sp. NPDC001339 TaxID=3364563 RepID=UPI00367EBA41